MGDSRITFSILPHLHTCCSIPPRCWPLFIQVPAIAAVFFGLKAAVLAIVLEAVFRIGKRSLKNNVMRALAAAAFVGIFFFNTPFPIIIFGAALIGFVGASTGAAAFQLKGGHGNGKQDGGVVD